MNSFRGQQWYKTHGYKSGLNDMKLYGLALQTMLGTKKAGMGGQATALEGPMMDWDYPSPLPVGITDPTVSLMHDISRNYGIYSWWGDYQEQFGDATYFLRGPVEGKPSPEYDPTKVKTRGPKGSWITGARDNTRFGHKITWFSKAKYQGTKGGRKRDPIRPSHKSVKRKADRFTRHLFEKKSFSSTPKYWEDVMTLNDAPGKTRNVARHQPAVKKLWHDIRSAGPMSYVEYLNRFGLRTVNLDYALAGEANPGALTHVTPPAKPRLDHEFFNDDPNEDPWSPPDDWHRHQSFGADWAETLKQRRGRHHKPKTGYEKLRYYEKQFQILPHVASLFADSLAGMQSHEDPRMSEDSARRRLTEFDQQSVTQPVKLSPKARRKGGDKSTGSRVDLSLQI